MVTSDDTSSYTAPSGRYNWIVGDFTIGDVIRKSRIRRRWSQTKLGEEATYFHFGASVKPINKSTVSKVEREPYSSELATIWRLLAALNLTFTEVEKVVGLPFERTKEPGGRKHLGEALAPSPKSRRRAGR